MSSFRCAIRISALTSTSPKSATRCIFRITWATGRSATCKTFQSLGVIRSCILYRFLPAHGLYIDSTPYRFRTVFTTDNLQGWSSSHKTQNVFLGNIHVFSSLKTHVFFINNHSKNPFLTQKNRFLKLNTAFHSLLCARNNSH